MMYYGTFTALTLNNASDYRTNGRTVGAD